MSISWNKEFDIWEYIPDTPEQKAFWRNRTLFDARCREASALGHARREERKKWQGVIAEKEAELETLCKQLAQLQAKLKKEE